MKTTLNDWPPGTPDYVNHHVLKDYIQETSRKNGVDSLTIFGARVTDLRKGARDWDLRFTTLRRDSLNSKVEEQERSLVRVIVKPRFSRHADEARNLMP